MANNAHLELINYLEDKYRESKINSKIEVKPKEYKPLKCPCCGGSINSISLCINDDYVKCEYCDTILTSKVKSQEIYLL